ncbi:NAD(P)/FAD-dependent oxidoreductase [Nocardia sp. NEAU-351]|uniref:NAD(P)/FAD-dependent oxidoreductase n=1 Tax=Nocardia bovistercoris TaxID=2785916 RepID=A0A931IEU4_9NOCA|nr:NAD(P)/FAD-dependent oxidoreductase [Nocardia bovistercoris]
MDSSNNRPDHEVAIIGGGFSGIGAAIALDAAGFGDYVVIEAGDGVGGAWHWNTYPGVGVDIPSFSYQFSFDQRADWSRVYAPGRELKVYADDLVDKYGVRPRLRLNSEVTACVFDSERHLWRIEIAGASPVTARFVIGATGVFAQPRDPDIAGLADFAGPRMHTARWDHGVDLRGKRVGIIGTGASAVQVIPEIATRVDQLVVFQRTPIWCLPKPDARIPGWLAALLRLPGGKFLPRWLSQAFVELTFPLPAQFGARFPLLGAAGRRQGLTHLRRQVDDPEVRAKLTPEYGLGCKRPSFHNSYLSTFNRDNVTLETTPIAAVTRDGVRHTDGTEHAVDVLVLATGFARFDDGVPPYPVFGRDGVALADFWQTNRHQAYEGVSVPGFPNMFSILGPYAFNGQSFFGLIETQMRHITRCLDRARREGATLVEIRTEANRRFFDEMLARRHTQIFWQASCSNANSYYFDRHGDVPFRPSTSFGAAIRSARFDLDDYRFETRTADPRPAAARKNQHTNDIHTPTTLAPNE